MIKRDDADGRVQGLLEGKVIITNTVTAEDTQMMIDRNVKMLVTSTPCYDGRYYADQRLRGRAYHADRQKAGGNDRAGLRRAAQANELAADDNRPHAGFSSEPVTKVHGCTSAI